MKKAAENQDQQTSEPKPDSGEPSPAQPSGHGDSSTYPTKTSQIARGVHQRLEHRRALLQGFGAQRAQPSPDVKVTKRCEPHPLADRRLGANAAAANDALWT